MSDIKTIVNHISEQAKKKFRQKGEIEPKMYFLILYPDQKTPVYYSIPVGEFFQKNGFYRKEDLEGYSQYKWLEKKRSSPGGIELKAVCCISDSWQSTYGDGTKSWDEIQAEAIKCKPSQRENRREAIAISVCLPERSEAIIIYYTRKGKNIEYQETTEAEAFTSTNTGSLFPKVL